MEGALQLHYVRRLGGEDASSLFRDAFVNSSKNACGVVKASLGRKETPWLDKEVK